MSEEMTAISRSNMSFISHQRHTPQEMVTFLNSGAMIRSFSGMLEALRPGTDVVKLLTDGLSEINGENRASTAKKVRNWVKGKNLPKDRETIFQICFVLKLSEPEADRLIGRLSDTGIHYRNPSELARAYALRTCKTYQEALRLSALAEDITKKAQSDAEERQKGKESPVYTGRVREAFSKVNTQEKFQAFFEAYGEEMGNFHETAYRYFMRMLKLLQSPDESGAWTLTEVMREYMQMHIPAQPKKSGKRAEGSNANRLDDFRKIVRLYWPNETSLSRMQSRAEDVSRKTLLLLYLATEAFDDSAESDVDTFWMYEDVEEDPDTMLEIRIEKTNLFLHTCGMNLLDPGNPFDLLLLYAIKTEADEEARLRMEDVLEILFSEE